VIASLRLGEWRDLRAEVRHIARHLERRHRIKPEHAALICDAVLDGLFYAMEGDDCESPHDVFALASYDKALADPNILAELFPRERKFPGKPAPTIGSEVPSDRTHPTGVWICHRCGTRVEDWLCCWNCGQGYSPALKSH
jgi:hypothetical protein